MYKINQTQGLDKSSHYLEIENSKHNSYAKIHLNLGASLQELILDGHHIIKDLSPLTYNNTYASSILFPFANRIKDGLYTFNGKPYQLEINQKEENNALHGLVYNKTFKLVEQKTTEENAIVKLLYNETKHSVGFPYTYSIQLIYTLTKNTIDLNVSIENTGTDGFPFTIGWHPYFLSHNLNNSYLKFDSNDTLVFDDRNITVDKKPFNIDGEFRLKNKNLDDCFLLNSNEIRFFTPKYSFVMTSSETDNFLQLYTPPHPNTIAIEPTTGVSDSFNNGIGLKTLDPQTFYEINWNITIN
ncbi:aldose epimerase [Yeosuana aromativorans]|uniref:Aldose epimerase n=1 Tax=Yeosuana aromativorans TaxID=288019 RepID=A0A8J3FFA3_9FLAO|nr:aldose 1-epimerase [Yeosuana aromativorans]GGK12081.1 aldose epimerase [Yeosuana aromativorans]